MTDPRIEPVRVREVFAMARDLAIGDRRVFLTSTCAGEPGVQEQVDRFLAAHQFARSLPGAALPTVADSNVTPSGDAGQIPGFELLDLHRRRRDGRSLQGVATRSSIGRSR